MTIHTIYSYWRRLLGLCLIALAFIACTKDYFVDETNFRIKIPQLKDGTIENLAIVVHNPNGSHNTTTRFYEKDFDGWMRDSGIVRIKLNQGKGYMISCFANDAIDDITNNKPHDRSYIEKTKLENSSNVFASRDVDPRSCFITADVAPLGDLDALKANEIELDESTRYKGKVVFKFDDDYPEGIKYIDIYYSGLATKYNFDGTFTRFTDKDRIKKTHRLERDGAGNPKGFSDVLNPSAGCMPPYDDPQDGASGVVLEIHQFYSDGNSAGVIRFDERDYKKLRDEHPENVPSEPDGTPSEPLPPLRPRRALEYTIKQNMIVKIKVIGWGDIVGPPGIEM